MTTAARESADDLVDDFVIFGLLNMISVAVIATGKIDGEMLQSGGVAKGEIAGDTAGVNGFFAILHKTVEVIIPFDTLV